MVKFRKSSFNREAFDAAVAQSIQHARALRNKKNAALPSIHGLDVDSLIGLELIYCFYKSIYWQVIGDPKSVFAVFHEDSGVVQVFTIADNLFSLVKSPWLEAKHGALESVQSQGASYHVSNGQVTCELNGVTAHGSDDAEAAMRAWLKYQ